ncbi:MAG: hypothetical protein JOZ03_05145 [Gammaproteobacteria bacterium]|nr:hypothetical protein [Gammaproteobacteria bacterium]
MTSSRTGAIVASVQLTLDSTPPAHLIRGYSAHEIRIGDRSVRRSCVVAAQQLILDWEPLEFAQLAPAHLERVLALQPELVLLGSGLAQRFAPAGVRGLLIGRGVGLETMELGAACRTYNVLVQEGRRVAAGLFLS